MSNRKEIHERVLNASNTDELMSAYSEWADKYDTDLLDEMKYVAPVFATKLLQEYLDDKSSKILDAGCGTGIVGDVLNKAGYSNIVGLDYSSHMLGKAEEKQVYRDLQQADLTQRVDIDDNTYDAIISVGTFTSGHVGPSALKELVRITKPEGFICFTVRESAWTDDNYKEVVDRMTEEKLWKCEALNTVDYIIEEGAKCQLCLYRVI